MGKNLRRVGFWAPPRHEHDNVFGAVLGSIADVLNPLPRAEDFVDPTWNPNERAAVLSYVDRVEFFVESHYGFSLCRICGQRNGSRESSDGTYVWPSGFSHYIREHGVRPPQEFIDHVLRRARR